MLVLGLLALANPVLDGATGGLHYLWTGVGAVGAAVVGLRRIHPARRRVWALLTVGLALTVSGDVVWAIQDWQGEVPLPGPADVPYLLGLAAMVVGASLLLVHHRRTPTLQTIVDAAVVAIAGALLLWLVVGSGLVAEEGSSGLAFAVALAYPLLDIVLLGALAAAAFGRGLRTVALALLAASFTVLLIADVLYLLQETTSLYVAGTPLDSLWLLAYTGLAGAILHPSASSDAPPPPAGPPTFTVAQVVGLGVPIGTVGIVVFLVGPNRLATEPDVFVLDLLITVPAAIVLIGLLLTRVAMTAQALARIIRERDEAYRRELGLARVASMLALADDVAAVRDAVHEAGAVVGEPGATVRLHLPRDAEDVTVADGPRPSLRLPLTPDPADGALVVQGARTIPPSARSALERVVSDVVMALDRCRLVDELRASEQRFSSLVRNAPDAITVHDALGRLTYVSPALGRITGSDEAALIGRRWDSLFHPEDLPQVSAAHDEALATPRGTAIIEARVRHADEGWRWVETRVTNLLDDPTVAGVVTNQRDTTERQRLQRQLQYQAEHDALTGLANRRRFGDAVRSRAGRAPNAVLFLDLDRFKPVNDEHGHAFGDRLLVVVADRIRAVVRDGDLAARLGGDEFAVLLPGTDLAVARTIGERLRSAISAPVELDRVIVQVDASIGVAATSQADPDRDLLQDADLAMYAAKQAGRARVETFTADVDSVSRARTELDEDLRRALADGQLSLLYRPIHRLTDGEVVAADAVVTWTHPSRGPVPDLQLRGVARRIGADAAITAWALREACWEALAWSAQVDGFTVAVSVDATELEGSGFADDVVAALSATGLRPDALTIEIGGAALAQPTPTAAGAIEQLRAIGVQIRLGDLGTGDTPVQRLRNAPVDSLRIAPELTRTITAERCEDQALVRAVLQLADAFHLTALAAGVEDDDQRAALQARGCAFGSGPRWGGAVPGDELSATLQAVREPGPVRQDQTGAR